MDWVQESSKIRNIIEKNPPFEQEKNRGLSPESQVKNRKGVINYILWCQVRKEEKIIAPNET